MPDLDLLTHAIMRFDQIVEQRADEKAERRLDALHRAVTAHVATANQAAEHWRQIAAELAAENQRLERTALAYHWLHGHCAALTTRWTAKRLALPAGKRRHDRERDALRDCDHQLTAAILRAPVEAAAFTDSPRNITETEEGNSTQS